MAVNTRSVPKSALMEPVLSRLSASQQKYLADKLSPRLGVLNMLAIPKTVEDLELLVNDHNDCHMFYPIDGQPRAYMQFPISGTGGAIYERWVYTVIGVGMLGVRSKCEPALCEHLWRIFVKLRQEFAQLYDDNEPILIYRRHFELLEDAGNKGPGPCFEHGKKRCRQCSKPKTRLTVRVCIPGLDLDKVGNLDGMDLPMLELES